MTTELTTILKDNELQGATAELITQSMAPIIAKLDAWEAKAKAIVVTDISQKAEIKEARAARLVLKGLRVDSKKKKDELKAESIKYNRAIDAIYRIIEGRITPIEDHLREQEEFEKREEERRIAQLNDERWEIVRNAGISDYIAANENLGEYAILGFEHLVNRCKDQKVLDEKAEADRLEQERLDAEEKENLRKENEKLRLANEKRDSRISILNDMYAIFDGKDFQYEGEVVASSDILSFDDKSFDLAMKGVETLMVGIDREISKRLDLQRKQDEEAEEKRKADEKLALEQRFTARSKHLLQNGFEEEFGEYYHKATHTISWETVEQADDRKFYGAITHIDNEIQRQKDQDAEDERKAKEAEEKAAKAAPDRDKLRVFISNLTEVEFPQVSDAGLKKQILSAVENFMGKLKDIEANL